MKTTKTKHPNKWENFMSRFDVAGVQYSDYQTVIGRMKPGQQVRFIGEPSNEFDNKAIRIEYDGVKIGYVPSRRDIQRKLWEEHAKGSTIIGVLTAINKTNPTWNIFVVQVLVKRTLSVARKQGEVAFSNMRAELSYQG